MLIKKLNHLLWHSVWWWFHCGARSVQQSTIPGQLPWQHGMCLDDQGITGKPRPSFIQVRRHLNGKLYHPPVLMAVLFKNKSRTSGVEMQCFSVFEFFTIELQLTLTFRMGQESQMVSTLASPSKAVQWSEGLRRLGNCQIKQCLDRAHTPVTC